MMGGGGGGGNATELSGVQLNSSNYGAVVPIVYGTNREATNVIWYGDFVATAQDNSGGKGGGGGGESYSYKAAVMLGICEGPIVGIPRVFQDRSVLVDGSKTALAQVNLTLFTGAEGQATWSYLTSNHPDQAINYSGTCYVAGASLALDSQAGLPNYNFEISGLLQVGSGNIDSNPAQFIPDFLTNARYGAYFPSGWLADLSSYGQYCQAAGFFMSPAIDQQNDAASYISDWMQQTNSEVVWSAGQLKIIPYADMPVSGNGTTYTPNTTPVYDLTDDDFLTDNGNDPVTFDETDPIEAENDFKVEYRDRNNNYAQGIAEAMDQAYVDAYGLRAASTITAYGICRSAMAQQVAQLRLQRSCYLRLKWKFKLSQRFVLLEPMDIVTISDQRLGLVKRPVRILRIEEDENAQLAFTAEDFIPGVCVADPYAMEVGTGYITNLSNDPGSVATPVIFNAPQNLTGGALQIWAAVGSQSQSWGGCNVWASLDGSSYKQIGTISGNNCRFGITNSDLPVGADPDTADSVSLTLNGAGQLETATTDQADAALSQLWIGGEVISYSAVTLTGSSTYTLDTYLRRGIAGTSIADHPAGSAWARLDNTPFTYGYSQAQIGKTMYVKFQSFNTFGKNIEDLADCTAYSIALGAPPPDLAGFGVAVVGSQATFSWNAITASQVLDSGFVVIRYSPATSGATWSAATELVRAPGTSTQVMASYTTGTYLAKMLDNAGQYSVNAVTLGGAAGGGGGTLSVSESPTTLTGSGAGSTVTTTASAVVSASGGTLPYTYAWSYVSGDTSIVPLSSSSPSTQFEATGMTGAGDNRTALWFCTVTDSTSGTPQTATSSNVSISINGRAPPHGGGSGEIP